MRDFFLRERPIEIRNMPGESMFEKPRKKPPYKYMWMKAVSKLPDDHSRKSTVPRKEASCAVRPTHASLGVNSKVLLEARKSFSVN